MAVGGKVDHIHRRMPARLRPDPCPERALRDCPDSTLVVGSPYIHSTQVVGSPGTDSARGVGSPPTVVVAEGIARPPY